MCGRDNTSHVVYCNELPYKRTPNDHCSLAKFMYKDVMAFIQEQYPTPKIRMTHRRQKNVNSLLVVSEAKVSDGSLRLFPYSTVIDTRHGTSKAIQGTLETLMSTFIDEDGTKQYVFCTPKPATWEPNRDQTVSHSHYWSFIIIICYC